MQTINLLYIITKLELGGAQKYLLSLTRHLDKKRFHPFLFTAKDGLLLAEALSIDNLAVKRSIWLERPINPLKDLFALIELCYFIKKNKIEFVHTHSSKAGILGRAAARLTGAKVIVHTVHGWSFNDCQPTIKRLFFIWLERITARFTDKLIVVSEYDKQKGIDNRIGADEKYALIRYGIDYAEFGEKDEKARRELGINTGELVVGMVSCFKPQKHPQDFIKLASFVKASLPQTKFLLVGDGVLRGKIERLIRKLNLEKDVILAGWRKDISRVLSAVDVFVLTSLWEGLPISVLEAMASSKPLVTTNTGGVAEIVVEGKMGFLVAPHDMKGMSERLVALLKDEDLRARMGRNARESLNSDFTLTNMVTNSQNLYETLLREKALPNAN
ncbi:MAG: glycosyltransferase family 4 protein [Candidatus Omnitrophica bacterium]|nr:glycosyltransferase family 4 protein [Candidatus Omnitrophota bacterium]MDD5552421.1 glycosyltransferase family 4 protein [Candidatus Omnitrophota bacterium]